MKIAVLSDSHGFIPPSVTAQLADCACILHAGDIVRAADLLELGAYGHLYAVQGNCDIWVPDLRDLKETLRFTLDGVSFLMTHTPQNIPRNLTGVRVVVYGHTHEYRAEWIDGVLWLNPGSCRKPRFGAPATMAKLTLENGAVTAIQRISLGDAYD